RLGVTKAIAGADRIAKNGDVANKIGTYGLATACHAHGVPFYVAAPTSTFDDHCRSGDEIPIEERHPDEIRTLKGLRLAPEGVPVWNPAFDVTPHRLVRAIITERGVHHAPYAF
ncbi:MAG: S-methyl-5-thioribose-1-phosphate isomerase, partial [Myxococcota bacterium]